MRVNRKRKKRFFTLTELLVVIIVLAILTIIAFPTFRKAVRRSREKEAKSMLRLIAQSEEMYKLESEGYYVGCSDTSNCNSMLDLSIASGASAQWKYKVSKTNPPGATFCAQAQALPPLSNDPKINPFHIKNGDDDPSVGTCP